MDSDEKKSSFEAIKKSRDLQREHADFFNWHNKETKERSLCYRFLIYLNEESGEKFKSLRMASDPPDCEVEIGGKMVGIEVAEFVDQKAIEDQIRKKTYWSHQPPWTRDMVMDKLNNLIQGKNDPKRKEALREKYERYIVLLHTDEPDLGARQFDKLFSRELVEPTDLVTEAYIIFSYDPVVNGYTVRRVL